MILLDVALLPKGPKNILIRLRGSKMQFKMQDSGISVRKLLKILDSQLSDCSCYKSKMKFSLRTLKPED